MDHEASCHCRVPIAALIARQGGNSRGMDRAWRSCTWRIRCLYPARHQGLDAAKRLNAKPRELTVLYYDNDTSPCACFADGIAIATFASVGQRTLTIAPEKAPPGSAAVIVIRPRQGGAGFKYTIPMTALATLGPINKNLDPRGRYDAVMAADGLFQVEPVQ